MNVQKEYRRGGFFGSSQDRFSDMEGAGQGINTAFKGFLGGKGSALRKEKRYLKKLERQGKLNEYGPQSGDRLDYLRNVQKDRFKKLAGGAALAAGAAFGAPALAGAVKAKGGLGAILKGAGKAGGKSGFKGLMDLFGKAKKAKGNLESIRGLAEGMSPEEDQAIYDGNFSDDPSMNPYGFEMGGKMRLMKEGGLVGGQKRLDKNNDGKISEEDFELLRGEDGVRIPEGADVRSLLASLDKFSEEKKRRRKGEMSQIAPSLSDEEMNAKVLSALLEKFKNSNPSIMGSKATDKYYNR